MDFWSFVLGFIVAFIIFIIIGIILVKPAIMSYLSAFITKVIK